MVGVNLRRVLLVFILSSSLVLNGPNSCHLIVINLLHRILQNYKPEIHSEVLSGELYQEFTDHCQDHSIKILDQRVLGKLITGCYQTVVNGWKRIDGDRQYPFSDY